MSLKLSKEEEKLVRDAASTCPDAERVLKKLYKDAFEEEENVTNQIKWRLEGSSDGEKFLSGHLGELEVAYATGDGMKIFSSQKQKFDITFTVDAHKITRK